jgi:hypothetical protein
MRMPDYQNLSEAIYEGVGKYNVPEMYPVHDIGNIKEWIGFNYTNTTGKRRKDVGVNFFLYDQQFERVWNNPNRYADFLSQFGAVLSPDFSLYTDFPKAVQIYNHYRNQWIGRYWQDAGLTVIPTVSWSDEESWDWCFDGVPVGSIVAVSNVGCMNSKYSQRMFMHGYNEMLKRLQPKEILFFAHKFDDYNGPVHYIRYSLDKTIQA